MRMIPDSQIRLFDGELLRREAANRQYMLSPQPAQSNVQLQPRSRTRLHHLA